MESFTFVQLRVSSVLANLSPVPKRNVITTAFPEHLVFGHQRPVPSSGHILRSQRKVVKRLTFYLLTIEVIPRGGLICGSFGPLTSDISSFKYSQHEKGGIGKVTRYVNTGMMKCGKLRCV